MLNMIVAYSKNRGIGLKNKIPWQISSDMIRFKALTTGYNNNSVIMGRKTWESLNFKPLRNRNNIIISTTMNPLNSQNINVFKTIEEANEYCKLNKFDENWVIGGSEIYNEYLKRDIVHKIFVTNINIDCKCDTFFPTLIGYKLIDSDNISKGDIVNFKYETYLTTRL
jgi:dihydrofolate reductase